MEGLGGFTSVVCISVLGYQIFLTGVNIRCSEVVKTMKETIIINLLCGWKN